MRSWDSEYLAERGRSASPSRRTLSGRGFHSARSSCCSRIVFRYGGASADERRSNGLMRREMRRLQSACGAEPTRRTRISHSSLASPREATPIPRLTATAKDVPSQYAVLRTPARPSSQASLPARRFRFPQAVWRSLYLVLIEFFRRSTTILSPNCCSCPCERVRTRQRIECARSWETDNSSGGLVLRPSLPFNSLFLLVYSLACVQAAYAMSALPAVPAGANRFAIYLDALEAQLYPSLRGSRGFSARAYVLLAVCA